MHIQFAEERIQFMWVTYTTTVFRRRSHLSYALLGSVMLWSIETGQFLF